MSRKFPGTLSLLSLPVSGQVRESEWRRLGNRLRRSSNNFLAPLAAVVTCLLLTGCVQIASPAGQTSNPSDASAQEQSASRSDKYEVKGFTSIDEDWAYKFVPPQSCDADSRACITLTLQTPNACERAAIIYRLESIHREFDFLQKDVDLTLRSNFSSGTELLNWKDPAWERVRLESVQCISPEIGSMAVTTGNLAPKLTVNSGFPDHFLPVNERLAFEWKEHGECKGFYDTCWSMYIFSATRCEAVFASFEIKDEFNKVLDTEILAARNLAIPARTPTAVQFGTSSKIDSQKIEKLRIQVSSLDCLDAPIEDEASFATTISQVDLPPAYCHLGVCNPSLEATPESMTLSRLLEYLQQIPTSPSGGLEYLQQFPTSPSGETAYRVRCKDGTYSNSGGRQGACSWHGGLSG